MEILLITASGQRKEFVLPDSWIETTNKQWLHLLELRAACASIELPMKEWASPLQPEHELVVANYVEAQKALKKLIPAMDELLTPEVVEACVKQLGWLAQFPDHYKSMRPHFALIFRGPKDQLSNWTWIRYAIGDELVRRYAIAYQDNDVKAQKASLNKLFAVLYAPFGYWAPWIADLYAKAAVIIPLSWKLEALANYNGLRNWLSGVYPMFFTGGDGDGGSDTMRRLTVAMAGGPFGTVRGVKSANIHDVCIYQEMKAEEMERMEQAKAPSSPKV